MLAQDDLVFGKKALDKVVARLDKSGDDTIACPNIKCTLTLFFLDIICKKKSILSGRILIT